MSVCEQCFCSRSLVCTTIQGIRDLANDCWWSYAYFLGSANKMFEDREWKQYIDTRSNSAYLGINPNWCSPNLKYSQPQKADHFMQPRYFLRSLLSRKIVIRGLEGILKNDPKRLSHEIAHGALLTHRYGDAPVRADVDEARDKE